MLADIVSRRRLLIAGILVWSVATMACGFVHGFTEMFIARIFVGLGEAALGPCAVSMIGDLFSSARRGRPMSVYLLGGAISGGLSIVLTGAILGLPTGTFAQTPILSDLSSWRIAFVLCGSLGLGVAFLLFVMPEVKRAGVMLAGRKGLGVKPVAGYFVAHWRVFLPFYLALGSYSVGANALTGWVVPFLTRHFHLSLPFIGQRLGGLNMAMAVAGSLIAAVVLPQVIRRGGVRAKMRLAPLLPLLALPSAFVVLSPNPWTAFVLAAIPSLALPLYGSTLLGMASELVPANMRGIAVALYAFAGTMIGATLGPLFVAMLTEHLFHDPALVGWSILIVTTPSLLLAAVLMAICRRNMGRLAGGDSEIERVVSSNESGWVRQGA
jgi:MFS family permease